MLSYSPPVFQSHITLGVIIWKNHYINVICGFFPLLPPLTLSQCSGPCFPECFCPSFLSGHTHTGFILALGSNDHNGVDNSRSSILSRCQFPAGGISSSLPSMYRSSPAQFHHILLKVTPLSRLLAGLEIYTGRGKIMYFVIVQNCLTSLSCCKNSAQCRKKEFPEIDAGAEALKDGWNSRYQISDLHT